MSNRRFLVDTGAAYSVLPHHSSSPSSGPQLCNANGGHIDSWGEQAATVRLGGQDFTWTFLLANVQFPILGADFLRHYGLVVDLAAQQLVDTRSLKRIGPHCSPPSGGRPPPATGLLATVQATPAAYRDLLCEFQDLATSSSLSTPPKHGVEHVLETTGRPVTARFRRLDADKLQAAKREFLKMEKEGIIRRSSSCWASPLHMVRKADGSWRPCGDYRLLNLATTPDKYPVPNMQDLSARLHGATVFSKLDLRKGYYQVPMRPSDVAKTAIITPFGLWEFVRMPFGLRNAGQTFQRLMDRIGAGLDFVFIYLDDILVASPDEQTHKAHLRELLQRLREYGMVLNMEKCEFGQSSVDFLGHRITASGAEPLTKHLEAIHNFTQPSDVKGLQSFLGLVNFYRRFIRGAAQLLKPLTDSLKGGKTTKLAWSPQMAAAFQAAKAAVCAATSLGHPDREAALNLAVDASDSHVGGVLQQQTSSGWQPLSFFSRKLTPAESRYSAFDRELLAAYLAVRHFRFLLEGRVFHILTDHKPLTHALHRVTEPWSARQQRQLSALAEFTADIRHVSGSENVVADAMSRPPQQMESPPCGPVRECRGGQAKINQSTTSGGLCSSVEALPADPAPAPLDFARLAAAQQRCPQLLEAAKSSSLHLQEFQVQGATLWCDVSSGVVRPLVPEENRRSVFTQLHHIAHPGVRATQRLISSRFVWPAMMADIRDWCRNCQWCARAKVHTHIKAPVQPIQVPRRKFAHVHLDLVGPFPPSREGHTHLFTMVDRATRWAEAVPLASTDVRACAEAFFRGWISRFGVPDNITTDRGAQFTSEVWAALCTRLGIVHHLTTAYHPQANGLVERFHRQLKESLRARAASLDWAEHLPWVLMGLRAAPKEDSAVSAAELVYGTPLTLPGEFLGTPELSQQEAVEKIRTDQSGFIPLPTRPLPATAAAQDLPPPLQTASHVYILRGGVLPALAARYRGPYLVLERAAKAFKLAVGAQQEWVSVDRLKPHVGAGPVQPQEPPRRGRPRAAPAAVSAATPPTQAARGPQSTWADIVRGPRTDQVGVSASGD